MTKKYQAETILLSDIHLGSPLSRAQTLNTVLERWEFQRLIIVGDLFASSDFKKLTSDEWRLLRRLSRQMDAGAEIIWVEGNHDLGQIQNLSHLLGIEILQEYVWEWHGKKCLAIHGHQFDKFVVSSIGISLSWIYLHLLKIGPIRKIFGPLLASISDNWARMPDVLREKCVKLAKEEKVDIIFAGHTHQFEHSLIDNITYVNTGCWVSTPAILVALGSDPTPKIFKY